MISEEQILAAVAQAADTRINNSSCANYPAEYLSIHISNMTVGRTWLHFKCHHRLTVKVRWLGYFPLPYLSVHSTVLVRHDPNAPGGYDDWDGYADSQGNVAPISYGKLVTAFNKRRDELAVQWKTGNLEAVERALR